MPSYLLSDLPDGSHKGPKPKGGFPKFNKVGDPIAWFLLLRDTTKRFQEASFPLCPDEIGVLDTGPKILDYYVYM